MRLGFLEKAYVPMPGFYSETGLADHSDCRQSHSKERNLFGVLRPALT